jgi:succinate dehydrogenase/fumarate reductase-like Fe-S protein
MLVTGTMLSMEEFDAEIERADILCAEDFQRSEQHQREYEQTTAPEHEARVECGAAASSCPTGPHQSRSAHKKPLCTACPFRSGRLEHFQDR